MEHYIPSIIMTIITLIFVIIVLLPILAKFGSPLLRFYWAGFWIYIALIGLIAGGSTAIMISGTDIEQQSNAVLSGIVMSFVLFVFFAWFRLVGQTLKNGFKWFQKTPHT